MRLRLLVALLGPASAVGIFAQQIPVPVVSGHPFSADEVDIASPSPNVRNVPPKQTTRVYRDSAGRTRIDASISANQISSHFVDINDPVAGFYCTLDSDKKVARRIVYSAGVGQPIRTTVNPADEVRFYRPGGASLSTPQSEPLGSERIAGLMAEGLRITTKYSPNSRGDEETWFSPDLQMTLRIQIFNSIMGNRTINLENLDQRDPDPSLFLIPSDYTILDALTKQPAK